MYRCLHSIHPGENKGIDYATDYIEATDLMMILFSIKQIVTLVFK